MYKAEDRGPKQIVITPQELRRALSHDATISVGICFIQTLYIMVIADGSASYFLKTSYEHANDAAMLDLNRPMSGIITTGQMRDFALEIETISEEEERDLHIVLSAASQKLYLYAKQCVGAANCGFMDDRIVKDKSQPDDKNVKINEISSSHKEIDLKLRCGKKDAYASTKVSDKITLYKCVVNIGVYSNEQLNISTKGTPFTILAQDKSMHHLLPLSHWEAFRLQSGETKPLQVNFNRKPHQITDYLQLKIDNHYGQSEILVSRKNKNPCNGTDLLGRQSASANQQQELRIDRKLLGEKTLVGVYYICIKATTLASLSVILKPVFKEDSIIIEDSIMYTLPRMIPNQQIMGQIVKPSEILYFTLVANLNKNDGESIRVHVTPISGSFQTFVSCDGRKPDPSQSYWNTVSSVLEIKPNDRSFKEKGVYIIGVKLNSSTKLSSGNQSNKFLISYSFSDKHIVLRPGLPFVGAFDNTKSTQYFHIRFPSSAKEVTFFKTALTASAYGLFSFNINNSYPTVNAKDAVMMTYSTAYTLVSDNWQKYCPSEGAEKECTLYVTVASNGPTQYSVQYNIDNSPITLPHDHPFSLPISSKADKPLHLVYHADKSKTAEFELRTLFQHVDFIVKWDVEQTDYSKYNFPNMTEGADILAKGRTDSMTQFIVNNSMVKDKTENHVLLVTLLPVIKNSFLDIFHFGNPNMSGYNGFLEISSGFKNLMEGRHVNSHCKYGEWKYFRLQHPYATHDISINVAMLSGVAEVYVSKGSSKLPSENYYLTKRVDYNEAVIKIDEDVLPPNTRFAGDYMVGVRCTSPFANFQVLYQNQLAKWISLEMGQPVTHTVSGDEATYIELPSGMISADVVLTFYSRYANLTLLAIPRKFNTSDNPDSGPTFPGEENYVWNATSDGNSPGFGRLVIKPRDQGYCTMCSYIIRVQASREDKVEFSAIKKTDSSFVRLTEGQTYLGDLKKGENDSYAMYIPANETYFSMNLRVLKGNLTLKYSMDASFTDEHQMYVVKEKSKNEFFHINFGKMSSFFRNMMRTNLMRFIKVEALEENTQYSFQVVSDGMLTELTTKDTQQSILSAGMDHYYYFPSEEEEDIDLYFHLRYVLDRSAPEFSSVLSYFPKMIKCYQVSTIEEVHNKKLDYILEANLSTYRHEVQVNMRPNKGFVVVVIKGVMSRSISYTLELSKFGIKNLHPGVNRPDHVQGNETKHYIIGSRDDNDQAKVRLDMCMNSIEASYIYKGMVLSNHKTSGKGTADSPQHPSTLVNQRYMTETIPIRGDSDIDISVKQTRNVDGGYNQETMWYPAIYNLHHEIVSKDGSQDQTSSSFLVGDTKSYAEVEVYTDEDQSVKFEGLSFHDDFLKKYKDYAMLVNYTLYMSKDKRMVQFMKYCDYYKIDEASRAFNDAGYSSYSVQEYYSEELHQKITKVPIISIKPHSLSFGGLYHGIVVAEIRLWPKTVGFLYSRTWMHTHRPKF